MSWSKERPTVPGVYWARWKNNPVSLVRVSADDRRVVELETRGVFMADLISEWVLRETPAELGRAYCDGPGDVQASRMSLIVAV